MKSPMLACLSAQMCFALGVSTALWIVVSGNVALSYLCGAAIFGVSSAYMTYYAFRYRIRENSDNQQLFMAVQSFKQGEFGKIVLTLVGFVIAFRFFNELDFLVLFIGFTSMTLLQIVLAYRVASNIANEDA